MTRRVLFGAAAEFTQKRFGGAFNELPSNPTVGTTAAELVGADPERVLLLIINLSTSDVFISFRADVSSTNGILLGPSGGNIEIDVEADATLPTRQYFAVAGAANSQVFVLQLRREALVPLES